MTARTQRRTCALALILVVSLAGCGGAPAPDANTVSVAVTTIHARKQTFHHYVDAWGEARADSRTLEHLSLAHGGRIDALSVTDGERVHKGDVLLRMRTDPAARNRYRQARNSLDLARGDMTRVQRLAKQHLATQSQLAAARKTLADAQAAVQAERELGSDHASYALKAPSDGVITALHVGRGDRVAADTALLDFTPAHGLVASLGVQPDRADDLQDGMNVQLKAVYDTDHDADAGGRVESVGQAIDPSTHLVPVRVTLPPALDARLVAGSALSGRIRTDSFRAWAVPRDAVLKDAKGTYLFQARKGHAVRVGVTVRQPDGATLGVDGKLRPDLPVIVSGAYELSDGDAVRESKQ